MSQKHRCQKAEQYVNIYLKYFDFFNQRMKKRLVLPGDLGSSVECRSCQGQGWKEGLELGPRLGGEGKLKEHHDRQREYIHIIHLTY